MKLSMSLFALPFLAATVAPAAFASARPAIFVVHRDIHDTQAEFTWLDLQRSLSDDGFKTVSIAMGADETAAQGKQTIMQLIDTEAEGRPVLLVGTSAVSDAVTLAAEAAPERVQGQVYISAADALATFGPHSVAIPTNLAANSVQVRISRGRFGQATEGGVTLYRVREEGHSTLPRMDDLADVIESVSTRKRTHA